MRRWLVGLGLLLVPAVVVGSCALPSFDDGPAPTTTTSSPGGTGGAGGEGGAGGAGGQECAHRSWPDPPDAEGGGSVGEAGGGDIEFWVAVNGIAATDSAGTPVGLDLDGHCTCQGDGSSCVLPPAAEPGCDEDEGVDNQLVSLFDTLSLVLNGQDPAEYYSERAAAGEWSLLLRVRDYNGLADDPQIKLAWYGTYGFVGEPSWDGTDVWPIVDSSVVPVIEGGDGTFDSPRHEDPNGYVTGRVLVASLSGGSELVLAGGQSRMALRFTGGLVTGTIHDASGWWTLQDGLIAARLAEADLFYALSTFRGELGEMYCTGHPFYPQVKPVLCNARDILSTEGTASQPCDALAIGVGFGAWAARPGLVVPGALPTPGCPFETDPLNDSCDS